jgi:dipeptidyl aminopeptidase/acylaminoacyl peptidase
MVGVDTMLARGYIDAKRLGVTGGSGGGLLTNWVVGHTHRFAAAVSQRSIADWAAWWYTADFTLFTPSWFREPPFRDPQDYVQRSPITYIERSRLRSCWLKERRIAERHQGQAEWRCSALKALHLRQSVSFPAGHMSLPPGKPRHRVERLQNMLAWFDKYLKTNQSLPTNSSSGG